MGTTTYRYNDARKRGLISIIPAEVQEQASRTYGKIQAAVEHNPHGIIWACVSLLVGTRLGFGSADMSAG